MDNREVRSKSKAKAKSTAQARLRLRLRLRLKAQANIDSHASPQASPWDDPATTFSPWGSAAAGGSLVNIYIYIMLGGSAFLRPWVSPVG